MRYSIRQSKGFSLIELMVSLLIGMITVVVVMQVLAFSEGKKRTTTTGSDAQINGNLGLFTIEREAKNAGWGIVGLLSAVGCPVKAQKGTDPEMTITLAPVLITDGASGAPDTIQFLSSSKGVALPTRIAVDHPDTAANFFVDSDLGIEDGDLMVAVPATDTSKWCTLFQVTNDPNPGNGNSQGEGLGQNKVIHNSGQSDWNHPGNSNFPTNGYVAGDYLINLGTMINHIYSIANVGSTNPPRALQLTIFNLASGGTTVTNELYPHIVDLQAQYGKDDGSNSGTADDGLVDGWDNVTPTTNAGWRQILAIRVAVLARSVNPEKEAVTFNAPSWVGGTFNMSWDASTSVWGDASWTHYRYKIYETIIPIRNLIWRQ